MYEPMDFSDLVGVDGLSDKLLSNHFKLYQGYVENANKLLENIREVPSSSEERRRLGWELNGVKLHEYYFENLTQESAEVSRGNLLKKIEEDFGSFENWKNDFVTTGMMRGIGWAILYYDIENDFLVNLWIGEHNINHLAGGVPLLVMDLWEHAYMLDFELDKKSYIETFMKAIDWQIVEDRFECVELEIVEDELKQLKE